LEILNWTVGLDGSSSPEGAKEGDEPGVCAKRNQRKRFETAVSHAGGVQGE